MDKFIEVSPVYKDDSHGQAERILVRLGHIDMISETDDEDKRQGAKCVLIVTATSMFSAGNGQSLFVKESYSEIKRKIAWGGNAP